MLNITSVKSFTHQGKVREQNQDTLYCDPTHGFWILADGMGGHSGGQIASSEVVKILTDNLPTMSLNNAIKAAQSRLEELQNQKSEIAEMGTTVVVVLPTRRGFQLGWIGDSRIYCYETKSKGLELLSHDHSFVQDLIDRGIITEEKALKHEKRHLIHQFIGMKRSAPELATRLKNPIRSGTLLLCSDGLSDFVREHKIQSILAETPDNSERSEILERAVMDTKAQDNISYILISYEISLGLKLLNLTSLSNY